MPASVIMPAYNEARVIERTLATLTNELEPGEAQVLVVCNGCRDDTAKRARAFADRGVEVLEIDQASKIAALNAGDEAAAHFPRVYLDADVELDTGSFRRLMAALEKEQALAAEPRPHFGLASSHGLVRLYYSVWQALHGQVPGRIGSGVVAVSRSGRERFGKFPDLIADDGFLRRQFEFGELVHVEGAISRVEAPRTLSALVAIKTRSRVGTAQLRERFPELKAPTDPSAKPSLLRVPWHLWPCVPVYVALTLWIRRRALSQAQGTAWQRDESSRE